VIVSCPSGQEGPNNGSNCHTSDDGNGLPQTGDKGTLGEPASFGWHTEGGMTMAMRKYIIERDIPKVGTFEREQLRAAAAKSNEVLHQLGPDIQWVESYVAGDKTFCVYLAKDEDIIKKHAQISGFPATKITEVRRMIDPTTEQAA
jgi:Nickel responsive protein SCO4226-like